MRRVFRDDNHQKHFDENGYVLVELYTPEQVEMINKIFYDNRLQQPEGLEVTIIGGTLEENKKIQNEICAITDDPLNKILHDYSIYYAGYVTKFPHKPNESRLHQDPSFVDEALCKSLDVWSPMIPTDEKNGALHVIRNSNRFFPGYRGYTCKRYDYNDIRFEVQDKFGTILKMQPGQAVMYDTATLHFSHQNETDNIRIACTCLVGPREADQIYYHHNKALNTLDIYKTDEDFILSYFRKYLGKDELDLPLISRTPFEPTVSVKFSDFEEKFLQYNPQPSRV